MRRWIGVELGGHSIGAVVTSADTPGTASDLIFVPPVLAVVPGMGTRLGAQAEQFAAAGVGAVFRDYFGRVGDPVPVVGSDGSARLGADLVAMTIGAVLRRCAGQSDIAQLVIAHPSGWGPYETSVLHSALTCTEAEGVPTSLVSGPVAAVTAAMAAEAMSYSETVIVADIGAHGTEVALVTGAENHAGQLAATSRTDDLSSAGLDRALARHVLEQVRGYLPAADDPTHRAVARDVAASCRRARQALLQHTSTLVEVRLPAQRIPIRIVRAEFEALARESVHAGLSTIAHVMRQARENGIEINAIVLTGELARTPLLAELISAQWPCRLIIPPGPEWAAASGAAQLAVRRSPSRPTAPVSPSRPKLSNSSQAQPVRSRAVPSEGAPAARQARPAGGRKWTLRWGALQVTAALMPRAVPRHG
jgi:Hsp70 protein